jgi:hypothetical protein
MIRTTLTPSHYSPIDTMDSELEAMETGKTKMTPFLLAKCESNGNLSQCTHTTDPSSSFEYSSHSSEDEVWTDDDHQTLNSLLADDEADQTLNSLLADDEECRQTDEEFLETDEEDSPKRRCSLRTRLDKLIPSEIVVIQESILSISQESSQERSFGMFCRLQEAELLVQSYKQKVEATESYGDSLQKYLRKTQILAEELSSENHSLTYAVAEMKRDEVIRKDQDFIFKTLIGACFVFYMFGGSEFCLVASVGLYLLFGVVSFLC